MRLFLAIAVCKILYFAGRLTGKGSSLPGRVALALYPDALKKIKLPKTIIAITGSNGKTSTTEMVAHALSAGGLSVGWNHEGANQIEGVATLILRVATLSGAVKCDALVFECDERYARKVFEAVRPSAVVVTNLCRDQLTRNGHHEFIQNSIRTAIESAHPDTVAVRSGRPETADISAAPHETADISSGSGGDESKTGTGLKLILNADDPFTASLAAGRGDDRAAELYEHLFFGISRYAAPNDNGTQTQKRRAQGMYDDGAFCPVCKGRMDYDYRTAAHMGGYSCGSCGFTRPEPYIEATGLSLKTGEIALNGGGSARLAFPSLSNAYNLAAAVTAATAAGIPAEDAARFLDGYELKGGRTLSFKTGSRDGILLVSKHENSLSYDQSFAWLTGRRVPCTVIIMVDSISRKYYTSETSWLWDVNFEILADECVRDIVLTGRYVNELAARLAVTSAPQEKIKCVGDTGALRECIGRCTDGEIIAVTCFSDKDKLLSCLGAKVES